MSTPRKDGFRLPAEFEFQNEGFMIWPQRPDNWRNRGKTVQKEFVKLITLLAKY